MLLTELNVLTSEVNIWKLWYDNLDNWDKKFDNRGENLKSWEIHLDNWGENLYIWGEYLDNWG